MRLSIFLVLIICSLKSFAATEASTSPVVEAAVTDMVALDKQAEATISELATPQTPSQIQVESEKATPVKSEKEIPVQLESNKKAGGEGSLIFKALASIAVVGILGIGAFLMIGRYRRTQIGKSTAPEIKILRQHYLGPKKSLAIIRVAGESILVGITDHNISMIKSLALLDEDVPEEAPTNFQSVFQKSVDQKVEFSDPSTRAPARAKAEDQDDFSISGIRDFVSTRLKNMRSLD